MPTPSPEPSNSPTLSPSPGEERGTPWLGSLQGWLDRLLVVDVFVVMAGALWFGLGVLAHARGVDGVLTSFQRVWMPVFQPALGLLMGAALLSGGVGWGRRRGQR
ncbi:MAG: hypothetical protein ACK5QW_03100 [Cyanobacteriota bacterium]